MEISEYGSGIKITTPTGVVYISDRKISGCLSQTEELKKYLKDRLHSTLQ